MNLKILTREYDKLQKKYGAQELDSIYNGGCDDNPDICFVFMNPTERNIASSKDWKGLKSPWIGTKNIFMIPTFLFSSIAISDQICYPLTIKRSESAYGISFPKRLK